MKTFTKSLLAAGVSFFGIYGTANAATPYGSLTSYGSQNPYGSQMPYDSLSSTRGIAVGGCYQNGDACCDTYGCCNDTGYRPGTNRPGTSYDDYAYRSLPARPVFDARQEYRTLPYPASRGSDCTWDSVRDRRGFDNFDVNVQNRWSNPTPTIHDLDYGRYDSQRYDDRYNGSPSFEPWRPMNVSNTSHRW